MKVENSGIDSRANSLYTRDVRQSSQNGDSGSVASRNVSDEISLSGASDLVSRAKNLIPADKLSKFEALKALAADGKYKADASAISQALIDGHLES